jgi:hypothetical protein
MDEMVEASSKLEKLAADAKEEPGTGAFMDPAAKKNKGGRPKGSKNKRAGRAADPEVLPPEPPPDPEAEREALKPVIAPVFKLLSHAGIAAAEDEAAAIPEEQQALMTHSAAGVVVKYMPGVSEHADLIMLSLLMGQWAVGVWMLRRANLEKLRAERRAQANGHAEPEVHAAPLMN